MFEGRDTGVGGAHTGEMTTCVCPGDDGALTVNVMGNPRIGFERDTRDVTESAIGVGTSRHGESFHDGCHGYGYQ